MPKPGRVIAREAARLTRSRARSFYLASLFLPRPVRRNVHIVYAYFRTVDDLVDERGPRWDSAAAQAQLDAWAAMIRSGWGDGDLMQALVSIQQASDIPPEYLLMVLEGARYDLDMQALHSLEDLIEYSVLVAGSVGMVMACILGVRSETALKAACDLGIAMQLTNVLRDVAEDIERGRIYLPLAELGRHGLSRQDLVAGRPSHAFQKVCRPVAEEARARYRSGMDGIHLLPRPAQFSIFLAATLYWRILDKIEAESFDVFARRVHVGTLEKWMLTAPLFVHHHAHQRRVRA